MRFKHSYQFFYSGHFGSKKVNRDCDSLDPSAAPDFRMGVTGNHTSLMKYKDNN